MKDPTSAAHAALERDAAHADPAIWITRRTDADILAEAARLQAEGPQGRPLWGLTCAVKDNIDVAGLPTTAACPSFAYQPDHDAPAVARLRAAGALIIGKTNLDQFATGLVGVRSPYGVPRNVFDASRIPGGSSSGSAVAVAAGIVDFALGTDTAGSGRVPAMFGNVVGLKPTLGSVSTIGVVPACRSIDTISVFAASVDAALAVQRVIAGVEDADRTSRAAPFAHLRRGAVPPAPRIAAIDPGPVCEPAVAAVYRATAERLGAKTVDLSRFIAFAKLLYEGPWVAERTAALRDIVLHRPEILMPATRHILEDGLQRRTIDAFDAFHEQAEIRRLAARLFRSFDALLLPTAPNTPTLDDVTADPLGPNRVLGTWTNFVNLCDLAGFAVPAGFTPYGLPVGVTLLGPAWSDGRLAGLADAVHRAATDRIGATARALPAAVAPEPLMPDETALFCIGAHMSGLPLNHQVAGRGGRLLRGDRTVASYRLYALGNRPGLLRVARAGAAIEGEVWALPTSAIGGLLAEVPPPLGFGTVQLETGPCLGFLAEAEGVAGAPDITALGGWRGFLASRERVA
jgi:allophanate hydrolase